MNKKNKDEPKQKMLGPTILSPGAEIIICLPSGAKSNARDTLKILLNFSLLDNFCFTQLNDDNPPCMVVYKIIEFNITERFIKAIEVKRKKTQKS